ncbi:hypothetical protein [Antrihabitans stalactiti]|uniref:Anti-sigma-M factor RsmA n=1 Tax=Antrihabitans stalactiti TaxID=2584121 RepID=A0A848KCQ6_9NOCA|nr:hypothetical protein [Antrihabitans stalactiti]NMN95338.1 hypothetical protein [Antrihabitans stalactiti]
MSTRSGVPQPPFSTELIADLHADNLPPEVASELWPAVRRDADAMRTLQALDRVSDELRALGRDQTVATTIPRDVAERLDQILDLPSKVSVRPLATLHELASRRRRVRIGGAAAALVAAAAVIFAFVVLRAPEQNSPIQAQPTPQPTKTVDLGDDLTVASLRSVIGRHDVPAPLVANLAGCLAANGLSTTQPVLGSAPVRFRGQDAVLLLVPGTPPPTIKAIVVGVGCKESDAAQLAVRQIG